MRDLLYLKIQVQIGSKQIRIQSLLLEPHVCFLSRSPSNSTIDCTQSVRPVFNWTPDIFPLPPTQGAAFTRLALGVPNSFPEPSVSNMRKALWDTLSGMSCQAPHPRTGAPDGCPDGCVASVQQVPLCRASSVRLMPQSRMTSWIFSGVF